GPRQAVAVADARADEGGERAREGIDRLVGERDVHAHTEPGRSGRDTRRPDGSDIEALFLKGGRDGHGAIVVADDDWDYLGEAGRDRDAGHRERRAEALHAI